MTNDRLNDIAASAKAAYERRCPTPEELPDAYIEALNVLIDVQDLVKRIRDLEKGKTND